jgi:hypothetical protein
MPVYQYTYEKYEGDCDVKSTAIIYLGGDIIHETYSDSGINMTYKIVAGSWPTLHVIPLQSDCVPSVIYNIIKVPYTLQEDGTMIIDGYKRIVSDVATPTKCYQTTTKQSAAQRKPSHQSRQQYAHPKSSQQYMAKHSRVKEQGEQSLMRKTHRTAPVSLNQSETTPKSSPKKHYLPEDRALSHHKSHHKHIHKSNQPVIAVQSHIKKEKYGEPGYKYHSQQQAHHSVPGQMLSHNISARRDQQQKRRREYQSFVQVPDGHPSNYPSI